MKTNIRVTQLQKQSTVCLVVGVYENGELTPSAKAIDKVSHGKITKLISQGVFQGKLGQTLPLFHLAHHASVLLVGSGKPGNVSTMMYRKIVLAATKALAMQKATQAIYYLTDLEVGKRSLPWKIKQTIEAAHEALYRFDQFKSEKEPAITLRELTINLPGNAPLKSCEKALAQGLAIADGVQFTKNLANLPSNICTPRYLATQAKELSKKYSRIKVNVLDEKAMHKLKMGAILAVSKGSAEEARLISIHYQGTTKNQAPIAFVGKGITFDTGGNSLKSPDNMVGMKYDMCGAATVLGTIKAAAELKLPLNLVGVIPAVENMPGGSAYKPEDILTSMSGQTIEVISTDAEGRLILGDALTYCERFKPRVVIDIATLTGAVVIALGLHTSGLLTNYEPLAKELIKAGEDSNDRAWQLPLFDEYQEQIKSSFADMANTGGRTAGTITAACFLSRFTKKFHWAHLDVAGTAAMMMGGHDRYATGRPVPLLVQYLLDRVKTSV